MPESFLDQLCGWHRWLYEYVAPCYWKERPERREDRVAGAFEDARTMGYRPDDLGACESEGDRCPGLDSYYFEWTRIGGRDDA